jgi:glycosyltransferase involved in cell wall biosynthesis
MLPKHHDSAILCNNMRIRVLLIITDLQVGGTPQVVKELACGLASVTGPVQYEVLVACLATQGPVAQELRSRGIATHCLGALGPWDIRVFWRLGQLISKFRPDVLHCSLMHANVTGRIIGSLLSVPYIIASIHTAEQGKLWHLIAENLTCRLSRITVCVSNSVRNHVERYAHIPPSRLVVIPNGIDWRRFAQAQPVDLVSLGLQPERKTLISVGRLDAVKAIDVLLHALARLVNDYSCNLQLLVVGDGPERKAWENLSRQLEITDRVCFCGTRRDVEKLLKAADIYVQPSRWEGLPLSALEAMAAGLPVVASRTQGLVDVINDKKTGILTPPGDQNQLAQALLELINQPHQAVELSKAAQKSVTDHFSTHTMLHAYQNLYKNIISSPNSPRRQAGDIM